MVPAGCQPWFRNHVVSTFAQSPTTSEGGAVLCVAYISTMTIHILQITLPIHTQPDTPSSSSAQSSSGSNEIEVEFRKLMTPFETNLAGCFWIPSDGDSWILACTNRKIHFGKWSGALFHSDATATTVPSDSTTTTTSEKFSRVCQELECKISVPWMETSPVQPTVFAFQSDVRTVKVLDISQFDSPQMVATINHDGADICVCKWRPGSKMSLFVGDISGSVVAYDLIAADSKKYKIIKRKLNNVLSTARTTLLAPLADETESIYDSTDSSTALLDLKFDPNNDAYLLIGFKYGAMMVYDVVQDAVIATFQRAASQLGSVEWVPTIPGGFITCDARLGVVRMWNVSQKAPMESVKLLNSPVHVASALYTGSIVDDRRFDAVKGVLFFAFEDGSV